jgi:transcriptional regulator with XRE-family HTH domain
MKFNERLKELRKELGYTQRDVGKHLGVGRTTVSEYEAGKIVPKQDNLVKLASFLGVSVDYLTGVSDDKTFNYENDKNRKSINVDHHILACLGKINARTVDDPNIDVVYRDKVLSPKQIELIREELRCSLIMMDRISKIDF